MTDLDDTQPNRVAFDEIGVPAPPRFLLWGVIGVFLLGIIGAIAGIYVFRDVLEPRYQQSVMSRLPFMEAFLPERPGAEDTLPTAEAVDQGAIDSLLFGAVEATEEATAESTMSTEPTLEATSEPEQTPLPTPEPPEPVFTEAASAEENASVAAMPTFTPQATLTMVPAPPTLTPTSAAVTALVNVRPESHVNFGFTWDRQKWNNCGPATVTTALSYYGWTRTQDFAASILRPNPEDKNVSPHELVEFVNEQTDVMALHRIGGNLDVLRELVANEFPVIVEVGGNLFEAYEWIGHYLTVAGYDDQQGVFYVYDSFLGGENGASRIESYRRMDETWKAFNRTFVVIYEPWREELLMEILGDLADEDIAAETAFEVAQADARADRDDAFAWFNMGTALTRLERYEEAAAAFDQATRAGMPWRTMWYQFEPFEAYFNVGDYDSVLLYVENNLNNGGVYVEETHYWRGRVFEAQGLTAEARSAFREALRRNRNFEAAEIALERLR